MSNAVAIASLPSTDGLFIVASAPAGWYEVDEGIRRWFDGRQWTDHYAPVLSLVSSYDPVRTNYPTLHGLHLMMAIMTLGAWLPVWVAVATVNAIRSGRAH